jgi:hypothetical protein
MHNARTPVSPSAVTRPNERLRGHDDSGTKKMLAAEAKRARRNAKRAAVAAKGRG